MTLPTKRLSDPPPRIMLKPEQLDHVGEALIALTREVWVLTDRVLVLEAILESKDQLAAEEVDRFQPSEALQKVMATRRERLIGQIEATLRGAG